MYYKKLGNTGKQVSAIAFGGMRFKAEEYKQGPERCAEIVLRARDLGINYFDTAPGYCDDNSEIIIGHAIRQMKEKPYVSTKCGLWMETTADGAYARVQKSLERLHVDKITVYNMWCIKTMEEYREMIKPGGIYDGIRRAKEDGLIEHICCSTHIDGHGLSEIVADGLVESVTLGYNALNFAYRREGVKACYDAGLGVVIMNPLGGGMIPRHADKFSFLRQDSSESIVQAALRFLIGQKEISAADKVYEVTEDMLTALSGKLGTELNTLCTGCAYCDECPVDVPVPRLMDAYNEYLLGGEYQKVAGRLRGHWGLGVEAAAGCVACGKCEALCTQKLPIIQRLAEIQRISQ